VEAIDLDSEGEVRNVLQLWIDAVGLVRHCGAHLTGYSDFKSKGFVHSIVCNFVGCYCNM